MKNREDVEGTLVRNKKALERGQAVLVQGNGFRCLAYQTTEGKWRNYFNDEELEGEIRQLRYS